MRRRARASRCASASRSGEILVVPGAFDALTGRLLERAGFEALYRGGYAASAAAFGLPDLGITSSTEMVDHARRLCSAVSLPVIADADTGYGEVAQVMRTVHELERAGVAAHPARGSGLPEALRAHGGQGRDRAGAARAEAARRARRAGRIPDTLIVARTDAIAVTGLDDAIARAHRYAAAGADVIFVDAPRSEDELRAIGSAGHRQAAARQRLGVRPHARPRRGGLRGARLRDRAVSDLDAVRRLAVDQGARRVAARARLDARGRAADDAIRRAQRDARQGRLGRDSVSASETVFTVAGTPLVFGPGASLETGWHLRRAGVTRALVVTDAHLAALGILDPVRRGDPSVGRRGGGLRRERGRAERGLRRARGRGRTRGRLRRLRRAGRRARPSTRRRSRRCSRRTRAASTTTSTRRSARARPSRRRCCRFRRADDRRHGAEATTVAIVDLPDHHVKTGISHAHLRPLLGIVDPDLTLTAPPAVTAAIGLDVLL